jgi:drug/metabolite transporter (DMT)-like permease
MKNKGIYFALATAVISGLAVFLNKFAGKAFGDACIFTTLKNIPVGLVFFGMIFAPKFLKELRSLNKKQWSLLLLIGAIGGSIPFLLFFKGLAASSAVNAAFIHKTLFIWVGILAVFFLKEKLGLPQIVAFALIFAGNILLGGFNSWKFGVGEIMIFGATLLWSAEYVLAKKVLAGVSAEIAAWARMFFGSIFLVLFLLFTGRAGGLADINLIQAKWILLLSTLLFGYVFTWYKALKSERASLVTCLLVPASLITALLNSVFITGKFSAEQVASAILFSAAVILFLKFRPPARIYEQAGKTI